jgi:hypothetical protein
MEMISYNYYHQLLMSEKLWVTTYIFYHQLLVSGKISDDYFQFLSPTFGEWKILK